MTQDERESESFIDNSLESEQMTEYLIFLVYPNTCKIFQTDKYSTSNASSLELNTKRVFARVWIRLGYIYITGIELDPIINLIHCSKAWFTSIVHSIIRDVNSYLEDDGGFDRYSKIRFLELARTVNHLFSVTRSSIRIKFWFIAKLSLETRFVVGEIN